MLLHRDRYSTGASLVRNGVTIHDSEGAEGLLPWGQMSSAQLVGFLGNPGDRASTSKPGTFWGAGYQAVATEDGGYITVADDSVGPYHAGGGFNANCWSICIPGRASQSEAQWLDIASLRYIQGVAKYVVDRWNHDGRVWPLAFAPANVLVQVRADQPHHPAGYHSHWEVTKTNLAPTNHTDVGLNFPWAILHALIIDLAYANTPPSKEVDMTIVVKPYDGPNLAQLDNALLDTASIALTGGVATWVGDTTALATQQRLGTIPKGTPQPVMRADLKAYRLVGPTPHGPDGQPFYGYTGHNGGGTVASDFDED